MAEVLTKGEILQVVNRYIGVSGGYLGDFSYRTHEEFYPEYCGLDKINPSNYQGTTRQTFIAILENALPRDQAKILRGVLKRFPPSTDSKKQMVPEIERMISRLETGSPVSSPSLKTQSEAVERAIQDALALLKERGPTSAVDRIHTALHGYLRTACDIGGFPYAKDATITDLFKTLRRNHPSLQPSGPRAEDITQILRALSTIVDVLNPLRNRASGAHPNPQVLEKNEAMLVINTAVSLLHYLDAKLS